MSRGRVAGGRQPQYLVLEVRLGRIGDQGQMLKSIGTAARKDIMEAADSKVHLFLFVKVRENWVDDPERYREMGLEFPRD